MTDINFSQLEKQIIGFAETKRETRHETAPSIAKREPACRNEAAKLLLAEELLLQGLSQDAVCRILNLQPGEL